MDLIHTAFAGLKAPGFWQSIREIYTPRELECIQVGVTSHCMGKCTYCPHTTDASRWNSRHMQPETFAALWPLMLRSARVHLQGWGEPFLNPYFMDYVRLAHRAECRVSTTTCGLRMDEDIAVDIVTSGMDIIAFSLAGTDETSNASRRQVPLSKVEHAVHTLQKIRKHRNAVHLEIHLAYLMLASQVEAVRYLPELMEAWDVHAVVVSTLDYLPSPEWSKEAFAPSDREKIEDAKRLLDEAGKKIRSAGRDFYASLPAEKPAPHCRERVHKTLYADAEGNISPCVYLNVPVKGAQPRRTVFGNVAAENALAVWNAPEYAAFRSRAETPDTSAVCRSCAKRFETFCTE